jgi:hypothetical protein
MALQKIPIKPGFNKQETATAAEGQWIDGDYVRFRYGYPEKIGGWQELLENKLAGVARCQLTWTDISGKTYAAIATNKVLVIYYSGSYYDITPLGLPLTGCTYTSITGSNIVTINKTLHDLSIGDYVIFTSVTTPGPSTTSFTSANFTTYPFEVLTIPNNNTFTIKMPVTETGTGVTNGGTLITTPYESIGPVDQTVGYGFGTGEWGGIITASVSTLLNGAINNSATTITVDSTTSFPTSGIINIDTELVTYTGKTGTTFTGCVRGANGSTAASHLDNATVTNATSWMEWGESSTSSSVILSPANWSLDNYGQTLIATIKNGQTYSWDPSSIDALITRATAIADAPTSSIMSIVSDRDRHLFCLGTETSIGTPSTQDPMFIRWSSQEDYNTWNPTATNTAGTFRLDTGNYIIGAVQGKDYILILTDQAAYVIQFVGPPYVFSVRQVGTNCGGLGQHSMIYVQGSIFWMGYGGGFFIYDGTVKQLPSLVSDFVFTTNDGNLGINYDYSEIVYCSHNSLYNEVMWFYPKATSTKIDRCVVFNFLEQVWYTMSLSRTTYQDAQTFDKPYATKWISTETPTYPIVNGITNSSGASYYYQHEVGTNDVNYNETVIAAIPAYIESGEFDISSDQGLAGDGEYLMKIRRFIPDFKYITGNAKITFVIRDYPSDSPTIIGPFTVDSTTTKVDTRARNRLISIKIENENVDENWRYGLFRLDIQPDGRR